MRIASGGAEIVGGWSLEPAIPAIVFDVAPEPGTILDVSYLVSNEG